MLLIVLWCLVGKYPIHAAVIKRSHKTHEHTYVSTFVELAEDTDKVAQILVSVIPSATTTAIDADKISEKIFQTL